jgi:putative cell wall-binding protein
MRSLLDPAGRALAQARSLRREASWAAVLLLGTAGAVAPAASVSSAAGGALVYGLTTDNHIVSFRAETPATVVSDRAVTGLQSGEDLLGIDIRPSDGQVYALASTNRLYTVDPGTGAATAGAALSSALTGSAFGIDVYVVHDVLRVVSDADQNLRVSFSGAVTVDPPLAYEAADPGERSDPAVSAASYTNATTPSPAGRPPSQTLYDIDTARDVLVTQGPPFTPDPSDDGVLRTVGSLGVGDVTAVAGLDIDEASGTAFAVLERTSGTGFYTVDLSTGAATLVGSVGSGNVEDVTVATPRLGVADTRVPEGAEATVTVRRTGDVANPATVDYATASGTADGDSGDQSDFGHVSGTVSFAPGETARTLSVATRADGVEEGDETFTVRLSNPTGGAGFTQQRATVTIEDGGSPTPTPVVRRAGNDRYATAAEISRAAFTAAPVAIAYIATGEAYPDALAGGPAAFGHGGPVLPVATSGIPAPIRAELERLKPARIVVLGGTGAVSAAIAAELQEYTDGTVTRIAGHDRYETAARVALSAFAAPVPEALVATGQGFADALAGGGAGATTGSPVLLVDPDTVPPSTAQALRELQPRTIAVLGGTSAVSDNVLEQLEAYATGGVARLAGRDRFDTAARISRRFWRGTADTVYLATGMNFPDALAGVPAAARDQAPLLLTQRDCMPEVTREEVRRLDPSQVVVLGGESAVGRDSANGAVACSGEQPTPSG